MTRDELQRALFAAITNVAPEAKPETLPATADIREELDIDSMDFLNVVQTLHRSLGVDIPERDYAKLFTVSSALDYLSSAVH
jgi:acyl carrier protein